MIHHASNGHPIQLCVVAAFFGGHLLFSSLRKWKRARLVQDTPVVPIKSAPQGLVEIEGHAWPTVSPRIAPLCQRPTVFYSLLIEHYQQSGKNSTWVKVYEDSTKDPFYILDATGVALINPDPGECTVQLTTKEVSHLSSDQKNKIFELMGKSLPSWFSGRYRVTEGVIFAGGPAYALGTFRTSANENKFKVAPGAMEFLRRISSKSQPASLLEMDHQEYIHNGQVDRTEQILYFNKVANEVLSQHNVTTEGAGYGMAGAVIGMARVSGDPSITSEGPPAEEPKCAGFMMSTEDRKIYFADCHKTELEKRLRSWFLVKVVGGALLLSGGVTGIFFLMKVH